jgi:hypothetical protein
MNTQYEIKPTDLSFYSENSVEEDCNEYETFACYKNNDIKENDRILSDGGYKINMSSFEHIPPKFLGIDTRTFGNSYFEDDIIHPFLQLKKIAMDPINDIDNRFQSVRYMVHIPYKNCHEHCLEACESIISDDTIEIDKRFYFISNNDKYSKLSDQLVYDLHGIFFKLGFERKYPLKILLISARYIISFYPDESDIREQVLDFVLDIVDDKNELEYPRAECADILYSIGRVEESIYGMKMLQELGYMDQDLKKMTIYSNKQNVHDQTINDNVKKIIATLHKEYLKNSMENMLGKCSLEYLHKLFFDDFHLEEDKKENVQSFFFRIMTDPTRFENLTLADIFMLVIFKIQTFDNEIKNEVFKRLLEEIEDSNNTCHTGYVSRLVNVLSGFVEGKDYILTIDPKDELRSAVFARLNTAISTLPIYLKEDVTTSLFGDDKSTFEEFLNIYGDNIKDELVKEYKDILSQEDVINIYEKSIKDFQSI